MKKFIPNSKTFRIVNVNVQDVNRDESNFSLTVRLDIRSKEQFVEWLKGHERLSAYTYRVLKTKPWEGKYIVYKVGFRIRCRQ